MKLKVLIFSLAVTFVNTFAFAQTTLQTYNTLYHTENQSLWQPGTGGIFEIDQEFFGFDWNESGSVGDIFTIAGQDFGAIVSAGTWGEIGAGITINFGTEKVTIDYDADMDIRFPTVETFQAGEEIILKTNWTPKDPTSEIAPTTYEIDASLWMQMGIGFNMSANLCAFGCTNFDIFDIDMPTETYNLVELSSSSGISILEGEIYESGPFFPITYNDPYGIIDLWIDLPSNTGPNANSYISGENLHYYNSSLYFNMYFSIPSFIGALHIPYVSAFFDNLSNSWTSGPFYLNYTLMEAGFDLGLYNKQHLTLDPEMHGKLDFPSEIDYRIVNPGNGAVLETGTDSVVNYLVGQDVRFDFPCYYDYMDIVPSFRMENQFRNHTYDSIAFDFVFEALTFEAGVEPMTVIPEICIPIYVPCGPWYCVICDWCYDGDVCTPAVTFNGFNVGFGPLVEYQPNLYNTYYDWVDNTWEMQGFNEFNNQTPYIHIEPSKFEVTATSQPVLCYGGNSGEASANVSNGNPPYTYEWSDGTSYFTHQTSHHVTGLSAGTHYVSVTDANGCMVFAPVDITEPALPISIEKELSHLSCYQSMDGAISITTNGGTPPYSWSWSNGATSESISGIEAGIYSLIVTDANNCTYSEEFEITQPDELILDIVSEDVHCQGESTGTALATASGGVSPFNYLWSNGATDSTLNNVPAGYYTVTVTDMNGCTISGGVDIYEPSEPLTLAPNVTNVACHGDNSGNIELEINGGTPPYECAWYNVDEDIWLNESSPVLSDIYAGDYQALVTDSLGCEAEINIIVTEPDAFEYEVTVTDVPCYQGNGGAIEISVSGATTPYTFLWSNGETTQNLDNIPAGTYTLTVTDANDCTYEISATVEEPSDPVTTTVTTQSVRCYGNADGVIIAETSGGTPPYTWEWSNGETGYQLTGMLAGTYTVTAIDAHGCENYSGGEITQPEAPLNIEYESQDVSCYSYNDGSIELTITGGTIPYQITWDNDVYIIHNHLHRIADIPAGTYNIEVVDDNQCKTYATFTINQPEPVDIAFETGRVSCFGGTDGYATTTVDGGTSPYAFNWSDGSTSQNLNNVSAGTYYLTLTDNQDCRQDTSVAIETYPDIIAEYDYNMQSCRDLEDASITLNVSGGTDVFGYEWSNGKHTQNINNLAAGQYSVTITDGNYCEKILDISIPESYNECLNIPNSFTPNGDGYNDTWVLRNINAYPSALVQVFAQDGRKVFEANGGYTPWDGQYKGKDVPSGIYYYVVNLNNGDEPYTGTLTILR